MLTAPHVVGQHQAVSWLSLHLTACCSACRACGRRVASQVERLCDHASLGREGSRDHKRSSSAEYDPSLAASFRAVSPIIPTLHFYSISQFSDPSGGQRGECLLRARGFTNSWAVFSENSHFVILWATTQKIQAEGWSTRFLCVLSDERNADVSLHS